MPIPTKKKPSRLVGAKRTKTLSARRRKKTTNTIRVEIVKKVFTHGGSKAVNLPKEFSKNLSGELIILEVLPDKVIVRNPNYLENMESDPLFNSFIEGIMQDALEHPTKLHDLNKAWGNIDDLLKDVPLDAES